MSIVDFEEEERKRKLEYPKFQLITGGKEPPSEDYYWLKDFARHGVFIAREKKAPVRWIASEYHVSDIAGDAYKLILIQWDPEKSKVRVHYSWIDGPEFCKDWVLVEVLDDGKDYPEDDDGTINRTYNETGLEGDVGVPPDSEVDTNTGPETVRREFSNEPVDIK